jgi:hypothetical protein
MALVYCQGDNPNADHLAKEVAQDLTITYPNHSWWVEVRQGCLIIKHFSISGAAGTIGMVRHLSQLVGDAASRKREVIRAAGELLERAGLPRGAFHGGRVEKLELDERLARKWRPTPFAVDVIH